MGKISSKMVLSGPYPKLSVFCNKKQTFGDSWINWNKPNRRSYVTSGENHEKHVIRPKSSKSTMLGWYKNTGKKLYTMLAIILLLVYISVELLILEL
jgi:hypothetical protein